MVIVDNYGITNNDTYGYMCGRLAKIKNKLHLKNIVYFKTIEQCLVYILQQEEIKIVKNSNNMCIFELLQEFKDLHNSFIKKINTYETI